MDPVFHGSLALWWHEAISTPPKARVLLVHGMSEHSARHLNTVTALTQRGFEVVRFDLRGMGRSGGMRQWIERFEDYVEDVIQVFNWICREREDLPLFVLGHSLGGAIATHFAATRYGHALSGLILSAPAYRVGSAVSSVLLVAGRLAARFVPTLAIRGTSDSSHLSRDPQVCAAFEADPLACHENTLQQGSKILQALDHMPECCASIFVPTVIFHGSGDRIIRLEGSFELLRMLAARDKTLHVLPGGYHEPHNDTDQPYYYALLTQWLNKHLA